jgi:hypothetical protein
VSPAVLQRQAALAGAALLAGLFVVALDRSSGQATTPPPPLVAQVQWETAVVWITGLKGEFACGETGADVRGIVHPVLLCGVKIEVSANGKELRTEVVGTGPVATGREFALTRALAAELGVGDGDRIRWRFAG